MSRGMTLGELMEHKGWTPPAIITKPPVQKFPSQYAIQLNSGTYYSTGKNLKDWGWWFGFRRSLYEAVLWTDKAIADAVIEKWSKESNNKYKDSMVIDGIKMKDNAKVVDVTKILKLYILKIGEVYYFTGGNWATKIAEAAAYQNKITLEKILTENNMTGYSEIIEIPLDREKFL